MAERSRALVEKFEQAVSDFVATVESLSEEQWQTLCRNDERSIGVLARHVACGVAFEAELA